MKIVYVPFSTHNSGGRVTHSEVNSSTTNSETATPCSITSYKLLFMSYIEITPPLSNPVLLEFVGPQSL